MFVKKHPLILAVFIPSLRHHVTLFEVRTKPFVQCLCLVYPPNPPLTYLTDLLEPLQNHQSPRCFQGAVGRVGMADPNLGCSQNTVGPPSYFTDYIEDVTLTRVIFQLTSGSDCTSRLVMQNSSTTTLFTHTHCKRQHSLLKSCLYLYTNVFDYKKILPHKILHTMKRLCFSAKFIFGGQSRWAKFDFKETYRHMVSFACRSKIVPCCWDGRCGYVYLIY